MNSKYFFYLILPLAILLSITSAGDLLVSGMYARETADWRAQSLAQDLFDLIVAVPVLLISAWRWRNGSRTGFFMLLGVLIFLVYTFLIYAFAVHFNSFFLLYCFTLALAAYSLIALLWQTDSGEIKSWFDVRASVVAPVIYALFFAVLFYGLWLSEIIPAIMNGVIPANLVQSGLFTNPVHVIDLSFLLPGFAIVAILLFRRHPLGYVFMPAIMTFSIVMTLSIASLLFYEYSNGLVADYTVALVMLFFALVSAFVFARFMKTMRVRDIRRVIGRPVAATR